MQADMVSGAELQFLENFINTPSVLSGIQNVIYVEYNPKPPQYSYFHF